VNEQFTDKLLNIKFSKEFNTCDLKTPVKLFTEKR